MLMALVVMAFAGASSAMGESTALCDEDPGTGSSATCPVGHTFTHVHAATLGGKKAKLLSSVINVECDVLFLGDALSTLASPLVIHGNLTYSNCTSCEVNEESIDTLIEVLKTAHELANVTGQGEVRVHCGFFINCVYNGENLMGHGLGPLLSSEESASISLTEQTTNKISGFCPETAKLDLLVTVQATSKLVVECKEVVDYHDVYITK